MKYAKQIQSFLSRKNIKVSLSEIKAVMSDVCNDIDNPTDEELVKIKEYFMTANQALSTQQLSSLTEPTQQPESSMIESNTQQPESSALSFPVDDNKRQMVSFKASQMGIQLAANQVDTIASKIDTSNASFTQTISDIESALTAYIDYQQSQEHQAVETMLTRVTNRVIEKNQAINSHLSTGIDSFTSALEVANSQLKSETASILARLKVPT